ncbi:hypothetical protein TCA2_4629 [Paenibacillus sp. TCA20]|uniref:Helix-turn-helix domain-containing protein n=1 Tax=Paenibacillus urinalis TaxID=521520 RepID=A0ABY7XKG3_9BACL|nr:MULTISPECIES: hypothetical protein [Paenibacillus]WDI05037.1 hypothetical protein PUW25_26065 [Paenibacillus urinalis]GAK42137.1 hypothetical protein TCA2_4629 [Paenibacillus sp. TCA20]
MKYVKGLDEKYYGEMIVEIDQKFQALHAKLNLYCPGLHLMPTPVTVEGVQYPYPLAAQIREIYLYMIGQREMPQDIVSMLESICSLIWENNFLNETFFTIDWLKWEKTLIGRFVRCTYIRITLDAGEPITAKQLALMTGLTPAGIVKAINTKRLHGRKIKSEWSIPAEDATTFIWKHVNTSR